MITHRDAYGEMLIQLAMENPTIVVVDADVEKSNGTAGFHKAYPERFFSTGIAEQNCVGVAAGLASCGKTAFVATFAVFTSMRASEQIRNTVCYSGFNVKAVGTHAGLETGADGPTHQSVEDVAIMRAIPGQRVVCPSTPNATRALTRLMAETDGPFYMRFGKEPVGELYGEDELFPLGGSKELRCGNDVAILACGSGVPLALAAAELLEQDGIKARVIDLYSLKPLDEEAILKAARETKGIVTVEDHSVLGGLGGAVCEITGAGCPTRVIRIGVEDMFGHAGKKAELYQHYGLTPEKIAAAARTL